MYIILGLYIALHAVAVSGAVQLARPYCIRHIFMLVIGTVRTTTSLNSVYTLIDGNKLSDICTVPRDFNLTHEQYCNWKQSGSSLETDRISQYTTQVT